MVLRAETMRDSLNEHSFGGARWAGPRPTSPTSAAARPSSPAPTAGSGSRRPARSRRKGAHVVMAARNQEKAAAAVEDIRASVPDASLELVRAGPVLAGVGARGGRSRSSPPTIASTCWSTTPGVMGIPERGPSTASRCSSASTTSATGRSPRCCCRRCCARPASRVVTVTSTAHHMGRAVDPANPHLEGRYGPWRAYGQAKLANFHFGLGLQRELERAGAAHGQPDRAPGPVEHRPAGRQRAGIGRRRLPAVLPRAWPQRTGMSADDGALLAAAGRHRPRGQGRRVLRRRVRQQRPAGAQAGPAPVRDGPRRSPSLWEVSERETGARARRRATRSCRRR